MRSGPLGTVYWLINNAPPVPDCSPIRNVPKFLVIKHKLCVLLHVPLWWRSWPTKKSRKEPCNLPETWKSQLGMWWVAVGGKFSLTRQRFLSQQKMKGRSHQNCKRCCNKEIILASSAWAGNAVTFITIYIFANVCKAIKLHKAHTATLKNYMTALLLCRYSEMECSRGGVFIGG